MTLFRALGSDRTGTSAAEFTLVLPLLMIFLFGTIDTGRFLWEYNRAEKATQAGARMAVVTNVIPGGLVTEDYIGANVGGTVLTSGDTIPAAALSTLTCSRTACACSAGGTCPAAGTIDSATFDAVVARMEAMKPGITAAKVRIAYSGSGIGFAGDPSGMDISPLVTVSLTGLQFKPITTFLFATITMPDFRTTLTAEDSAGSQSN